MVFRMRLDRKAIMNMDDSLILFLAICMAVILAIILIAKFIASVYVPFVKDREYITDKILVCVGEERMHWKRELRRLYIEQIPFVGPFLAEQSRKRSMKRRKKFSYTRAYTRKWY